jgi:hypothetical protein
MQHGSAGLLGTSSLPSHLQVAESLRGPAYSVLLEEVSRRAAEAWDRGATEVHTGGALADLGHACIADRKKPTSFTHSVSHLHRDGSIPEHWFV